MNHFSDLSLISPDEADVFHLSPPSQESLDAIHEKLDRLLKLGEWILEQVDEPVKFEIPSLLRGMAINQARLHDSILFVCKRHRWEVDRCRVAEELRATLYSKRARPLVDTILIQAKKERVAWERMLHQFDVGFHCVQPGVVYDPICHTAVEEVVASDPTLAGTIEKALTPCYRWRDENGVDQVLEAEVILRTVG